MVVRRAMWSWQTVPGSGCSEVPRKAVGEGLVMADTRGQFIKKGRNNYGRPYGHGRPSSAWGASGTLDVGVLLLLQCAVAGLDDGAHRPREVACCGRGRVRKCGMMRSHVFFLHRRGTDVTSLFSDKTAVGDGLYMWARPALPARCFLCETGLVRAYSIISKRNLITNWLTHFFC